MPRIRKPVWLSFIDEQLLDAFVDNPYECPIVIDKEGIVRFMSRYNVGLYGKTPEQAVGKHITEINKNSRMHETLVTGKPEIGETYLLGSRQQIVARIPLRDQDGNIIGVLGKRIFHRLEKVRDLYRKLEVLEGQLKYYRKEVKSLKSEIQLDRIVGSSDLIREEKENALQAAKSDAAVLLTGESGTGKEACAYFIHHNSRRAEGPFIRVNCAAIPHELIESELFGYEGGAFTGARPQGKPGRFELAQGGTILLDEIGDMPPNMQAKLLRVLQEHEVDRVGGTKPIKLDFRLICSTNRDLQEMIKKGAFRTDLYYRINIFMIHTPSLRSIPEDIPAIALYLMEELSEKMTAVPASISDDAMEALKRYSWPGNVRELRNVLERAMITAEGDTILFKDLPTRIREYSKGKEEMKSFAGPLRVTVAEAEKKAIAEALQFVGGNKVKAAKLLGVHRTALYQKIKRYKIQSV